MKKNNKKKRLPGYWLGTRKPTSLGYQPNYGIGNTLFTSVQGEDLTPEVKATKANIFPGALNKLQQHATPVTSMLQNLKPMFPAAAATATTAKNLAGVLSSANMPSMQLAGVAAEKIGENAAKQAAKKTLGVAGTVAGALGSLYGIYDIANQFGNAGNHRSMGDMRNTLATNTYTTENGNQYTEYGGINANAERQYEAAQRRAKQANLIVSGAGTGASIGGTVGSIVPGLGTLLGTGIGAIAGTLFGGISSLLGFGDNEDEIEAQMRTLADVTSRQNRQSKSGAENQDVRDLFYNRADNKMSAATGKQPNAMLSNGEIAGAVDNNGNVIYAERVGVGKDNNDTVPFHLPGGKRPSKNSFVISNVAGLSDIAAESGDYKGVLELLDMIMNKHNNKNYKCGKLPKYSLGKIGEYALATLPGISEYLSNLAWYNRDKYAAVPRFNYEVTTPGADAAINQIMSDLIDPREYLNQSNSTYRQAAWNLLRNPAMGLGGRMVMLDALNRAKFAQDAETRMKIDEANRNQRNIGRKYRIENDHLKTQLKDSNFWKSNAMYQQAMGAKYTNMKSDTKNQNMGITNALSNALAVNQFNKAMDIQNRTLGIYQLNADTEKIKAMAGLNNPYTLNTYTGYTPTNYFKYLPKNLQDAIKISMLV